MVDAIKIGSGIFLLIVGFYIINKFLNDIYLVIAGALCASIGIGILASTVK